MAGRPPQLRSSLVSRGPRADFFICSVRLTKPGIIAPITTLTSADSVCHLAEELKDASRWLPRIMVAAAASNFTIGFILLVVILYRAGDIQAAINSPTGQPYIEILLNATQSVAGTAVLTVYIILALIFCATNVVTTSSRQLFSFARDRGVPFSSQLSRVSERSHVPVRAIMCTISVTVILSLILIGSTLACKSTNGPKCRLRHQLTDLPIACSQHHRISFRHRAARVLPDIR